MEFKEKLTEEKEMYYVEKLQNNDTNARNILIEHNLRLVAYIAKKFRKTYEEYEEIINVGTIGLIKGIDTYNINQNVKLSSYCSRCIINEILMFLRKNEQRIQHLNQISLSNYDEIDEISIAERIKSNYNLEEECIKNDNIDMLKYVLMMLPERERKILFYYIICEKRQDEIGKIMNLQQATVSRILKKTYIKIKPYFDIKKLTYVESQELKKVKKNYLQKTFKI